MIVCCYNFVAATCRYYALSECRRRESFSRIPQIAEVVHPNGRPQDTGCCRRIQEGERLVVATVVTFALQIALRTSHLSPLTHSARASLCQVSFKTRGLPNKNCCNCGTLEVSFFQIACEQLEMQKSHLHTKTCVHHKTVEILVGLKARINRCISKQFRCTVECEYYTDSKSRITST